MSASVGILQEVLAAEHAAVYGYGVVGARLTGSGRRDALAALDHHRARRDRLRTMIVDLGQRPVESSASYLLPEPVTGSASAVRLAVGLEEDIAVAFGVLVESSTSDERAFAARSLQDAAIRGARWGGRAARFPGLAAPLESPGPSANASTAPTP